MTTNQLLLLSTLALPAQAQRVPAAPAAPAGALRPGSAAPADRMETVTLDTRPVKMRIDPKKPITQPAPNKPAPKPRPTPQSKPPL